MPADYGTNEAHCVRRSEEGRPTPQMGLFSAPCPAVVADEIDEDAAAEHLAPVFTFAG
jgi:hypothetical protein